ncbi:MAG: hypothetical protein HY514_00485 [Candidatus Aenigmarchaeota archaeon]|nr:hypothetical protein [Candidatus Aenigmarchaeota archaeon]
MVDDVKAYFRGYRQSDIAREVHEPENQRIVGFDAQGREIICWDTNNAFVENWRTERVYDSKGSVVATRVYRGHLRFIRRPGKQSRFAGKFLYLEFYDRSPNGPRVSRFKPNGILERVDYFHRSMYK